MEQNESMVTKPTVLSESELLETKGGNAFVNETIAFLEKCGYCDKCNKCDKCEKCANFCF